jgi:hypothetical protein
MDYNTGKLLFIFMVAVLLSFVGAWWVARRYRAAMRTLMSAPLAASPAVDAKGERASPTLPNPSPVTADDNRRAGVRLVALLMALSVLISLSSAALQLHVVMDGMAFSVPRLLTLGFVHLWPVIPCLGLLWRWSRLRVLGVLLLWLVVCFAVVLWRSVVPDPGNALLYLAIEVGPAMVFASAVCLGGTMRAIAPWLLLPMVGLVWASMTGLDMIALMLPKPPEWFLSLTGLLGVYPTMLLFTLAPWLLAWWPLKRLGRALARAYTRKWLSDLMVLFTAVWGISLLDKALISASDLGLGGAVMLLPLLWVPIVMGVLRVRQIQVRDTARPPTLLVLRVFQHDARTQALFDHVIERWRLSGNTVLIAGTDLADRTLDADDIFTFIDGRLAERFIHRPADVHERLAAFDLAPDADGRYRINECFCHDTTWRQALAALVQRSDVVLMDLRSFRSHNEGCRHELSVLARAARLRRVVVLTDGDTDRAAAADAAAGAPAERFVWLDSSRGGRGARSEVLRSLFGGTRAQGQGTRGAAGE